MRVPTITTTLAALAAAGGFSLAARAPAGAEAPAEARSELVAMGAATIEPAVLMRMTASASGATARPVSGRRSGNVPSGPPASDWPAADAARRDPDGELAAAGSGARVAWHLSGVPTVELGVRGIPPRQPERGWLAVVAPRERDLGLFLAAQASLLIDMAQTMEIGRMAGVRETNRLLGERPDGGLVAGYFGSVAALHAAVYATLPGRWANWLSRGILFVEVPVIDNNSRVGVRVRF